MTNDHRTLTEYEKRKPQVRIFNFISDNCTGKELAIYARMQRHAGLNGICFASDEVLKKECNVGGITLQKVQQKFLTNDWIQSAGKMAVLTNGGKQFIETFYMDSPHDLTEKIAEGSSVQTTLEPKGSLPEYERVVCGSNYIKERLSAKILLPSVQTTLSPRDPKTKEDLEREEIDRENQEKRRRQIGLEYNLDMARKKAAGIKISDYEQSLAYITT
jgi:hypothetical protein